MNNPQSTLAKIKAIPYMKLTYGEEDYVIDTDEIAEAFIALSEENETLRIEHGKLRHRIEELEHTYIKQDMYPHKDCEFCDKTLSQITL